MGIERIPNPLQESFGSFIRPGWWVGWNVGWWTGWWNPFDLVLERIDPRVLGELVTLQGDFAAKQGQLVQELGRSIAGLRMGGAPGAEGPPAGGAKGGPPK